MCGIVGYVGEQRAVPILLDGLRKLEYRGYDSAGIALVEQDGFCIVKQKGRLQELEKVVKTQKPLMGSCGIGHTRWATHGEPNQVNSHPQSSDRVTVVHNGIIENYFVLKQKLLKKGYTFSSETDTEVVAKLLDYYYKGDPFEAIRRTLLAIEGAYALGILFVDQPQTIFAVRKDSPLIVGLGENEQFLASDVPAILSYTREYYLIEPGEIVMLQKEKASVFTLDQEPVEKQRHVATWDMEQAEKNGYPHFMLKEIFEQPDVVKKTIQYYLKDELPNFSSSGIKFSDDTLANIGTIHMVACGTASYASMVGQQMLESVARVATRVWIASEFRYANPILSPNDLVVVISQSGETADTLAAVRLAKERGVHTMGIVNVVGSSIAREVDSVMMTFAGLEIAVASTKAYTVQLAALFLFSVKVALCKGTITAKQATNYIAQLTELPTLMERLLNRAEVYQHASAQFQNADHLFFMGRGVDFALSMEGSLKLKEISYIHCEAYAAGELKHGTISLITDHVPVIALATQEPVYDKMCSNIKEVKSRGAKVLLITKEGFDVPEDLADLVLKIPAIADILVPLVAVLPLQLFAYYTAVLRGCDVDKPRNLAKSVTVE